MNQATSYLKLLFGDEWSTNSLIDSLMIESEYCESKEEILNQLELIEYFCTELRKRFEDERNTVLHSS